MDGNKPNGREVRQNTLKKTLIGVTSFLLRTTSENLKIFNVLTICSAVIYLLPLQPSYCLGVKLHGKKELT
jgi:hypothetical protein